MASCIPSKHHSSHRIFFGATLIRQRGGNTIAPLNRICHVSDAVVIDRLLTIVSARQPEDGENVLEIAP